MNTATRRYEQKKRAELQDVTRQRIVEAAVALHQELGPAHTSVSSIADHAGVSRPTIYRHFPDERSIFQACTGHYLAQHPPPDFSQWEEIEDPVKRLTTGLRDLYGWYGDTAEMMTKTYRDLDEVPILEDVLEPLMAGLRQGAAILSRDWVSDDPVLVNAAIGHAMAFQTWRSLTQDQGLDTRAAIELMAAMVEQAARYGVLAAV